MNEKRNHQEEVIIKVGKGNATTSKATRYDLIPYKAMKRLADRFELGLAKHGKDNWRKGLDDDDYIIERCNHVIEHAKRIIEKIESRRSLDGDDDAGGIIWGGAFLCEAIEKDKL